MGGHCELAVCVALESTVKHGVQPMHMICMIVQGKYRTVRVKCNTAKRVWHCKVSMILSSITV